MQQDVKKFILKAFILLIPVAGLIAGAYFYVNVIKRDAIFQNALENKIYNLIVHPKAENIDLLVMGDSRAERFVDPSVFEASGLKAINVGIDTSDFISAFNSIKKYDLEPKVLVLSVSLYQVNDGATAAGNTSPATLAQMEVGEMLQVFKKDYGNLIRLYINTLIQSFKPLKYSSEVVKDGGLLKVEKEFILPIDPNLPKRHGWYPDLNLQGAKWRIFQDFLKEMSERNIIVIIYDAPVSPAWREMTKSTNIERSELEFAKQMQEEVLKYKNIYFLDFYTEQPTELTNQDFYDIQHTNGPGAYKFTKMLEYKLREYKIIP